MSTWLGAVRDVQTKQPACEGHLRWREGRRSLTCAQARNAGPLSTTMGARKPRTLRSSCALRTVGVLPSAFCTQSDSRSRNQQTHIRLLAGSGEYTALCMLSTGFSYTSQHQARVHGV